MRLALGGRLLYGAFALANLWFVAEGIARREWLGVLLALLLTALFGVPALTGRDSLAYPTHVPRWIGRPDGRRD
jgi:hypothetical protein